jgi:hemerythrin HHE cation binding domain-containing protein
MSDALQLLREDHRKVQDLFKEFDAAERAEDKKRIVTQVIQELEVHSQIEEEIFYPAVRREADPDDAIMDEAEEEHHVVDTIIEELRRMQPRAKNYDAKFKVLAENVKHHIQEEETMMLPKAAELGGSRMAELGGQMLLRKAELTNAYTGRSRNGSAPSRNGRAPARRRTAAGKTRTRSTAAKRTGTRATARPRTTGARSTGRRAASRTTTATRSAAPRTTTATRSARVRTATATRSARARTADRSTGAPRTATRTRRAGAARAGRS